MPFLLKVQNVKGKILLLNKSNAERAKRLE